MSYIAQKVGVTFGDLPLGQSLVMALFFAAIATLTTIELRRQFR